jgi:hypothetical protein
VCDQPPDCQKTLIGKAPSKPVTLPLIPGLARGRGREVTAPPLDQKGRPIAFAASFNNPQGKPAGSRPNRTDAKWCRCGLIDALLSWSSWLPSLIAKPTPKLSFRSRTSQAKVSKDVLRKEVIQPQVPLRLPCYDLVPITGFIFGACLAAPTTSDAPRFGGLTGGVYKAQEHIHRRSADRRLLAIPASCGRVAAHNPN